MGAAALSTLRARCPHCRTLTAVAVGDEYQCHSCGAEFGAGLVRVPRAWGRGGDAMAEAALMALPYPEASLVAQETLEQQSAAVARDLPRRPLVLGGCCCAHVGAIRGVAARHDRLAVVWLDAHGDLNTPESSPSGNEWGMPLRMAIEEGCVDARAVALVGTRNLDASEDEFMRSAGIDDDIARVLAAADAFYVALDLDVLAPGELSVFMPEPGGLSVDELEAILTGIASSGKRLAGLGLTGLRPDADAAVLGRLASVLGL